MNSSQAAWFAGSRTSFNRPESVRVESEHRLFIMASPGANRGSRICLPMIRKTGPVSYTGTGFLRCSQPGPRPVGHAREALALPEAVERK